MPLIKHIRGVTFFMQQPFSRRAFNLIKNLFKIRFFVSENFVISSPSQSQNNRMPNQKETLIRLLTSINRR
jgi:hypothetical protein